ncbi:hypothetical protein QBC47DRAFT_24832 [Echria macrotheca]|uniref:Uncharacterized protein n=1 Tax=Echria macrotheca TaxID=438768 RepID=A0AAJ0BN73_9PEZI|nr:hypothetical protein QBC47DRAFT_24832 [Echria macrotheca]
MQSSTLAYRKQSSALPYPMQPGPIASQFPPAWPRGSAGLEQGASAADNSVGCRVRRRRPPGSPQPISSSRLMVRMEAVWSHTVTQPNSPGTRSRCPDADAGRLLTAAACLPLEQDKRARPHDWLGSRQQLDDKADRSWQTSLGDCDCVSNGPRSQLLSRRIDTGLFPRRSSSYHPSTSSLCDRPIRAVEIPRSRRHGTLGSMVNYPDANASN